MDRLISFIMTRPCALGRLCGLLHALVAWSGAAFSAGNHNFDDCPHMKITGFLHGIIDVFPILGRSALAAGAAAG
jgi:hypothetical protein